MATTVNRYTKTSIPRYDPMSLEELMLVPAYKRKQHDTVAQSIADTETALAQIDPLELHSDLAKEEQQKLYDKLQNQANILSREGFTGTSKSDFINLNKEYQKAISPTGQLGKINAAKSALEKEKNDYIVNATKDGYPADIAIANWKDVEKQYEQQFRETGKVENIPSLYAPKYYNVVDEAQKLLKDAGYSVKTLYNDLGTSDIISDKKGNYVLTTKGYEKYGSNAPQIQGALDYMTNQINNPNSEIGRSLEHQRKTPQQALKEIENLGKIYIKSEEDKGSGKMITNFTPAKDLGVPFQGNLAHESKEAETVKLGMEDMSNKLKAILSGSKFTPTPYLITQHSAGIGLLNPNAMNQTAEQVSTFDNRFTPEQQTEYNDLANRLVTMNPSLSGLPSTNPKVMTAVQTYLDNNSNILRQDILITDDFVVDYGDRSIGIKATDGDKIGNSVKNSRDFRRYFVDGEVVNYEDLPSEIKQNFDKLQYTGYYSPKNFMTDKYGKFQDRKLFVSPIRMQYVNDKGKSTEILVSRSQGEMENPAFKADMIFNDTFVNTNKFPGLPYTIPGTKDEVVYYPNGVPVPGAPSNAKYMINRKDQNGSYDRPVFLSESELQDKFYEAYGVVLPSQTKNK